MAVAAQFDVDAAAVADFCEGLQDGRKVDLSFAEHQVFVRPAAGVVEMHIGQPRRPAVDHVGNRRLASALKMAHVERQSQVRSVNPREQFLKPLERINQHSRLGLETDRQVAVCGVLEHFPQPVHQPIHRLPAGNRLAEPPDHNDTQSLPSSAARSIAYL